VTTAERVVVIILMVVDASIYASIVSSVTSLIASLNHYNQKALSPALKSRASHAYNCVQLRMVRSHTNARRCVASSSRGWTS
jgi:hypothetical protein